MFSYTAWLWHVTAVQILGTVPALCRETGNACCPSVLRQSSRSAGSCRALQCRSVRFDLCLKSFRAYLCGRQEHIESENGRLEREQQFWAKEIVVKIEYKFCPNLTIIDTPGAHPWLSACCIIISGASVWMLVMRCSRLEQNQTAGTSGIKHVHIFYIGHR